MINKITSFAMVCAVTSSVCYAQEPMSIDACIKTALTHNRLLKISEQSVRLANGHQNEVAGVLNPQIGLYGQAREKSGAINLPLAVGIDNGSLVMSQFPYVPQDAASYGISVNQVIDISGMVHTGIKAARIDTQNAKYGVRRTQNDTVYQLKLAYYEVLRYEELLLVAQGTLKNAETRRTTASALVETGIASKVDVIRADASISSARQSIISVNNGIAVAKAYVNQIMGVDIASPLVTVIPPDSTCALAPYESYLAHAMTDRPEMVIARNNVRASQLRRKLANSDMAPSVVVNASEQFDNVTGVKPDDSATIGLVVSIPISDGGVTSGKKQQADAALESSMTQEADTQTSIALQVKTAYVHMQNAKEKLATAKLELEQANESLRLSRARYTEGMASQVELSDAELVYTQASTNVATSRYELLCSQAELDRAVGYYAKEGEN